MCIYRCSAAIGQDGIHAWRVVRFPRARRYGSSRMAWRMLTRCACMHTYMHTYKHTLNTCKYMCIPAYMRELQDGLENVNQFARQAL